MHMNVAIIACSILFTNRAAKGWDGSNLESVYVDDEAVRVDVNNRIKRGIDCDEELPKVNITKISLISPTAARVEWAKIENAKSYSVRLKDPHSQCVRIDQNTTNTTSVMLRDLDSNTDYTIVASALNSNSCSDPIEVQFRTDPTGWKCATSSPIPGKVQSLEVVNITFNRAEILWAPTPRARSYKVFLATLNSRRLSLPPVNVERVQLTRLDQAVSYTASLVAVNGEHEGPPAAISFTTMLENPKNFKVVNESSSSFQVSWQIQMYANNYTVTLYAFDENGEAHQLRDPISTMHNFIYFSDLTPATRYRVSLRAFSSTSSSEVQFIREYYTKLPMTDVIIVSNVTDHSVFAQWGPVEGALWYRLTLIDSTAEKVKNLVINGTSHLIDDLTSASEYDLQIRAVNHLTNSLPKIKVIYTRLRQIKCLNVEKGFVEDTSVVLRWEQIPDAWYNITSVPPIGPNDQIWDPNSFLTCQIINLSPGTNYTFTVRAKNDQSKDTASLPAIVTQFTRLSSPLNFTIRSNDVTNDSMLLSWLPVRHAASYLVLVFRCDETGRDTRKDTPHKLDEKTMNVNPHCRSAEKDWEKHGYKKSEDIHLRCAGQYSSVKQLLQEGEKRLPSKVSGQGRTTQTEIKLSEMRPNTLYEIVVVAGRGEKESKPSRLLRFTKLSTPRNFHVNKNKIFSSSMMLEWDPVEDMEHYQLDIFLSPHLKARVGSRLGKLIFINKQKIVKNHVFIQQLRPSTRYLFKLTARNQNTSSFSVRRSAFTRLRRPSTIDVPAEERTPHSLFVQWGDVADASYYNVRYAALGIKNTKEIFFSQNVTSPRIFLRNLTSNTRYEINITARNRFTRSPSSTITEVTKLQTPKNFTVINVTDTSMSFSWTEVAGRVEFRIAYFPCGGGPEGYSRSTHKLHFRLEPLRPNNCYVIRMKATNTMTESDHVETRRQTRLSQPQQVNLPRVDDEKIDVQWRGVTGSTAYSFVVTALFNESQPNQDKNSLTLSDVIEMEDFFRLKRNANFIKGGSNQRAESLVRRTRNSDAIGEFTAPSSIEITEMRVVQRGGQLYKERTNQNQEVFTDSIGRYLFNVTFTYVIISKLESSVKYRLDIQAVNQQTTSRTVTKERFTELKQPQSFEARDVTNTSAVLRWRPVDKAAHYQVRVMPTGNSRFAGSKRGRGMTSQSEITVQGLYPNTNYDVILLARNSHVSSAESTISLRTKLSAVGSLRILPSTVTHDSFYLKWDGVDFAERYLININPVAADGNDRFVVRSPTELMLRRLEDGTKYEVTVVAENSQTPGMEKSIVQFTRLLTPRNVTVVAGSVTATSFSLEWDFISKANRYRVDVNNLTHDGAGAYFTTDKILTISGLLPGQHYTAHLIAENTDYGTFSASVQVSLFTKLETPRNVRIPDEDVTESSMHVTWDPVPLATAYVVHAGIEGRDSDHHRIFLRLEKLELRVSATSVEARPLLPASYYLVEVKAVNRDTESFPAQLRKFTKLERPKALRLEESIYMDTEADVEWEGVEGATYYILMISRVVNITSSSRGETMNATTNPNQSLDLLNSTRVGGENYYTVKDLLPETRYAVSVSAFNHETRSEATLLRFTTKSECRGDFHYFPRTHLSQALPSRAVDNITMTRCLELCCKERKFECLSVSLHLSTSNCLLFSEDRNSAPPLAISRDYDHYERKFWREVSGFQIRSITHNNVAVMNQSVELTLTFVYLGKIGCVEWDFGDGGNAFQSIRDTDCSFLCDQSENDNCFINNTWPNENGNQITIKHDYDMEDVFVVSVNVTDFASYEVKKVKIAINKRGCIYPSIIIEDEGKNINNPKILHRSDKLLLSSTTVIACQKFPGVAFDWGAISYASDLQTISGSISLEAKGSEILVPPLTFGLGLYRVSVTVEVLDEEHNLMGSDAIFIQVVPSPLVAKIKGGTMRTIGAGHDVTWDGWSVSYDPDVKDKHGSDLHFTWFCKSLSDHKFRPLLSGSCVRDVNQVIFTSPGVFRFNTSLLDFYVPYVFSVFVKKGNRENEFQQTVIVKEGDPPDFFIQCVDNCKSKMNPTQMLGLQVVCSNCRKRRNPSYKWTLYEVASPQINQSRPDQAGLATPTFSSDDFIEQTNWEANTTTGSTSPIVVIKKNSLFGGRRYVLRINITMDGLDGRVFSFANFDFLTNLPPYGGICTTSSEMGNCFMFLKFANQGMKGISHKKYFERKTLEECQEHCCLTRDFMCLSLSYNEMTSECWLFEQNQNSVGEQIINNEGIDLYERIFFRGGAVVDEIIFECKNWKDEGELQNYPKPGERAPQTSLTYKFTTVPDTNSSEPLLLYFGSVQKTPGISMALGDQAKNFSVSVIAQVCDIYGECAHSNLITLQIVPPDSNIGKTLTGMTSGNASKLGILSTTGNSKAAAQLVQSISSLINNEDTNEDADFTSFTTTSAYSTTAAATTASSPALSNKTKAAGLGRKEKTQLRSNVVHALLEATSSVTSLDNLQQMTSAMSAITRKSDQIDKEAQKQASNSVKSMAGSLESFSKDSNKEDVAMAAGNIVGSLGSVAKASMTDMSLLQEQLSKSSEINYNILDQEDLSPDEYEYYNKKRLREEKKRVTRSARGSQEVLRDAMTAMSKTGKSLLGKQMEGEPSVDVKSKNLQMKVEKMPPSELSNRDLKTDSGASIKLPGADALFGKKEANSNKPIDLQVTSFSDNPFSFGDDAAFIDSPVTMLKLGDEDGEGDKRNESKGVGISVPSKFDPYRDMVTVNRGVNDTGLSISKFEVKSRNRAILILVEPDDDRAEFEVLLKLNSKPKEDEFDYRFELPKKIWEVDAMEDRYKIFIEEKNLVGTGVFFIGIKDKLNVTAPVAPSSGRVRRRRSVATINSTTYHLIIATPGCRRFDQKSQAWTGDSCWVGEHSTPEVTECTCLQLSATSIFSAEFFVPPNTINFATVFAKINIADNPAVFSTVIAIVAVYLLMLVWAGRADTRDQKKWSLKLASDNIREDKHQYQVTVFTGHGRNAATHSRVSLVVFGENGKSRVRRLMTDEEKTPFQRSSVVHFLLRESKSLGELTHIHIWHDNSGKGEFKSWYLDQIVLQEVSTGKRFFFICDRWLAVDQDNGRVDRIIPLASPENMSTFHRLFVSTSAQKLTEDHLWISVFYRPIKSNFNRKQRLSCCMALLFMTMIANAMFFESGGASDKAGTATFRLGPFMFSPLQLWTSFCSTLLVVPATTLIMTLFKKAKTKQQEANDKKEKENLKRTVKTFNTQQKHHISALTLPAPSELAGSDAVYQINNDGTINATRKVVSDDNEDDAPLATWPHACVYVAWALTWAAVLLSGFFAILYSFEWGREKAERWLSNMMLSFWQSVLIVQPIKVIILAMFIATIVKKPHNQGLNSVGRREVDEVEKKFVDLCSNTNDTNLQDQEAETPVPPRPPSKRKLRRARRLRQKEKAMTEIIWEIIVYFIYIMILLFLCHASRDVKGQRITEQIKKTFVTSANGFDSVTSVQNFWRFINNTFLPNLYPTHWYNGVRKGWRNRNFINDGQSYRVGPARMRQIRVQEKPCTLIGMGREDQCRSGFLLHREEKHNFLPGWVYIENATSLTEDELVEDPSVIAWRFQDWIQLKGVPFVGKLSTYPGNGYSAELGVNFESGRMMVNSLYRDAWINQQTRAVFVEFTLYNPNVNLFTSVELLTEFPPVGAAVTFTSILTFRLYQYVGALGTWVVLAQIVFVLHMVYLTASTAKQIYRKRCAFFQNFWNSFEFFVLVTDWVVTSLFIFQAILTNMTLDDFHENKRKYVNFQQVTMIDMVVGNLLAILAFCGIIRFLKLLRFNRKVGMLTSVLKGSAKQWPGFFVLSAVFFVAFIHIGYLIYSPFLTDFRTIIASTETIFSLMMGRPLYQHLRGLYKVFGPIYYFVFCFTAAFIIINVLIAIINESYGISATEAKKKSNDYEVMNFMMKRLAKWTGVPFFQPSVKEGDKRKARISPAKAPLPPLGYELDSPTQSNLLELQKQMDKYVYDLECKYSKHLDLEELRDEVIAEMGKISLRNNFTPLGVSLNNRSRGATVRGKYLSSSSPDSESSTSRITQK